MRQPLVVYLDSNDYSNLSDPILSERNHAVRATLLTASAEPQVMFAFSGAHISEMAPMKAEYAQAGIRRVSLLVQLCSRNTMISFDKVIRAELRRLATQDSQPLSAINTEGEWFPDIGSLITPLDEFDIKKDLLQIPQDESHNRKSRRAHERSIFNKKGKLRAGFEHAAGRFDFSETLKRFPMRPKDARILMNYLLGKATRGQANAAFLESLRDPSFMAQWFIEHHEKLGTIGDWVRKPAETLVTVMKDSVAQWHREVEQLSQKEQKEALKLITGASWEKLQERHLLSVVNRVMRVVDALALACVDIGQVDKYCPGLAMALRTLYTSVRQSFGHNARKMKDSDFVDAVHSIYVPYVSMFRADKYMASIITPLAKPHGTEVFSSLEDLVEAVGRATAPDRITGSQ